MRRSPFPVDAPPPPQNGNPESAWIGDYLAITTIGERSQLERSTVGYAEFGCAHVYRAPVTPDAASRIRRGANDPPADPGRDQGDRAHDGPPIPTTHEVNLAAAETEGLAPTAANRPGPRPHIKPDTFMILTVGPSR